MGWLKGRENRIATGFSQSIQRRTRREGDVGGAGFYTGSNRFSGWKSDETMDHLWTPWRYAYVTSADAAQRPGVPAALANGMDAERAEEAGGLILRGKECFICLNAFPYTSGHVMVMPYAHLDRLALLSTEAAHEMMDLAQRTELALQKVYNPQGFNFGLNVGRAAGAGVAGHLHLHALPRWAGDTNFMTVVGETRILPEELTITWKRMREAFGE
jgi:ATP adenylyltransferase